MTPFSGAYLVEGPREPLPHSPARDDENECEVKGAKRENGIENGGGGGNTLS